MKLAVCYENGQVFQHFGHTEQFKVYTIENGTITHSEIVSTNGQGHGALAGVLPRTADTPAAPLPGEMLVLAHFRPGMLEGLLQGLRAAHVPPVALKAMLTDTNAAWTAPALYAEIAKEHAAMHGGGRAHKA